MSLLSSLARHLRAASTALLVLAALSPAVHAAEPKLIRIGVQQGLSGATPLKFVKWIEEQGYRVEWTTFQNAGASSTALAAGSIDMQVAGLAPEMALATKDPDIWLVATSELNSSQLVVGPNSGIRSIADLKGKTISTADPGSQQYALLVAALKKEKLTVKDLRVIATPANTMPGLLEKGSIDGFFAWPPFTSRTLESGQGKLLASATPEFHAGIGGKGPWVGEGWAVNAKFAQANRDAVIAVLRAEIRYFKLLHDSPEKGRALMAAAAGITPEHVAYIIKEGFDLYPIDVTPDPAVVASMLDLIEAAGLVTNVDKPKFLANFVRTDFAKGSGREGTRGQVSTARAGARAATAAWVPVLLVLAWQLGSAASRPVRSVVSSPEAVAAAIGAGLADGTIATDLAASLQRALLGWIVTVAIATPLAIAAGRFRLFGRMFVPLVDLLRPISPIAWIPLAVLWLGIGLPSKILVVFIVTFFVVFLNVHDAVTRVPVVLLEVCRTFTASRWFLWTRVILPASIRGVFLGSQYGLTTAWGGVIVAELVGANSGVGYQMMSAANQFEPSRVIAYMVLIGAVGIVLNGCFVLATRRLPWLVATASAR